MEGEEKASMERVELREDQHAAVIDERRRALVSALKSGKWVQTCGALRRGGEHGPGGGFCCLGVACEMAIKDGLGLPVVPSISGRYTYGTTADSSQVKLPEVARQWYGFRDRDPSLQVPQRYVNISGWVAVYWQPNWEAAASTLNDNAKLTLPQIGECFQYTFLRDEWEAEHGAAAS
jgi:hypothetical protein